MGQERHLQVPGCRDLEPTLNAKQSEILIRQYHWFSFAACCMDSFLE